MLKVRKNNKGFTLAETLIVVVIILVLAALTFVAVINHMRSMAKLEYDSYAKEIFIAAQNHLSLAESQGYLGRTVFGAETGYGETEAELENDRYYVVNSKTASEATFNVNNQTTLLSLMLPFGSIDETVRCGGCYVIHYNVEAGQVLDVYYWSEVEGRYAHKFNNNGITDYPDVEDGFQASGVDLKNYGDEKAVIGYYGGAEAQSLPKGEKLTAPGIFVRNAERLTVTILDNNTASGYTLSLIVKGKSGGQKAFDITALALDNSSADGKRVTGASGNYVVTLDDITQENMHYAELVSDSGTLIPGDDITIQAVVQFTDKISSVAKSPEVTDNSLFANGTTADKALIANIRHLENLDNRISKVGDRIKTAEQTADLSWSGFTTNIGNSALSIYSCPALPSDPSTELAEDGNYVPVLLDAGFTSYDGKHDGKCHSVTGLTATVADGSVGMFGELTDCNVYNLMLKDCSFSGANAGALAGSVSGGTISNVVAVHSPKPASEAAAFAAAHMMTGTASTGGLIGTVDGATVEYCAAALLVNGGSGNAGGLIGEVTGTPTVTGCYAGGHTKDGAYDTTAITGAPYNVTGGTVGGLIGAAGSATIFNSYSTCSASGTTVGGLVGTGGTISASYATGLVSGTTVGAFAGSGAAIGENCYYYEIINELEAKGRDKTDPNYGKDGFEYLSALGGGTDGSVKKLDETAASFVGFINATPAGSTSYDFILRQFYQNKYGLKTYNPGKDTINGTETDIYAAAHYGDWPAPETWVINP